MLSTLGAPLLLPPLSLLLRTHGFIMCLNALLGRTDFPPPTRDEIGEHRCEGLGREISIP